MKAKDLLTPARRVDSVYSDIAIGEAIKKMESCHYTMIPVIERNSTRYLYSISAGDILRRISAEGDYKKALEAPLSSVKITRLVLSCTEDVDIDELYELAINQNFIPLVDGSGTFRGIITRRAIINYLISLQEND